MNPYLPPGYVIEKTNQRVPGIDHDLVTRSRRRAERRARKRNAGSPVPFYRWEVRRVGRRWGVVALQNVARKAP